MSERLPETPALLALRQAVRDWTRTDPDRVGDAGVVVALSGGPDSLALCAAAVAEIGAVEAIVVDHGLQDRSAEIAARAAHTARMLGVHRATVVSVDVTGPGGREAAARRARYRALDDHRTGRPVLLGHTLDDQAETVLLGFGRGSGPRSVAGMRAWDSPWGRPLLAVRRQQTEQTCHDLGLQPWSDPHNRDPRYTRVRIRGEVLPLLEEVLGGGVASALARTATRLDEDDRFLDDLAETALRDIRDAEGGGVSGDTGLPVDRLEPLPSVVRRRLLRRWLIDAGVSTFADSQLRAIDAMVGQWKGQGPVAIAGGDMRSRLVVRRRHGRLIVDSDSR